MESNKNRFSLKRRVRENKTREIQYEKSSFLSKLRSGAEVCHSVDFKVKDKEGKWTTIPLWVRLLTIEEQMQINDLVEAQFKSNGDSPPSLADQVSRPIVVMRLMMERAFTVKEKSQTVLMNELKDIPETHLFQLNRLYSDLCAQYDPSLEDLVDMDLIDSIIDDLEKKKVTPNNLSRQELAMVIKYLILDRVELKDRLLIFSSAESTATDI